MKFSELIEVYGENYEGVTQKSPGFCFFTDSFLTLPLTLCNVLPSFPQRYSKKSNDGAEPIWCPRSGQRVCRLVDQKKSNPRWPKEKRAFHDRCTINHILSRCGPQRSKLTPRSYGQGMHTLNSHKLRQWMRLNQWNGIRKEMRAAGAARRTRLETGL